MGVAALLLRWVVVVIRETKHRRTPHQKSSPTSAIKLIPELDRLPHKIGLDYLGHTKLTPEAQWDTICKQAKGTHDTCRLSKCQLLREGGGG